MRPAPLPRGSVRRAVDVLGAALGLLLLSPVMALIAVLIRRSMGSPVLFHQVRSGRDGEEFRIVKFRTMRAEAFPGEDDAARTPRIGALLRASSLDEIPQLWNVLRGEMSLIGPRPTLPEQVVHYSPRQRRRLEIAPGMTGWAQVKGRNRLSWPERIELDIDYIDNRSLAFDLKILAMTLAKLLRPEGVTGEGGINPGFPLPEAPGERPGPGPAG